MEYYLSFGLVMGLTSGLAPGPLLTLVITESLQYGVRSGIKVALAPVISDAPIIILMLFLVDQLTGFTSIAGLLSLLGSCYIFYLAYDTARLKLPSHQQLEEQSRSLAKGVLANVLNPHPYLFWLTVGAPTIIKSASVGVIVPVVFMAGFYIPLVGSKVVLAVLVGKHRDLLSGTAYGRVMRVLAVLLAVFAALLLWDGLKLLSGDYALLGS